MFCSSVRFISFAHPVLRWWRQRCSTETAEFPAALCVFRIPARRDRRKAEDGVRHQAAGESGISPAGVSRNTIKGDDDDVGEATTPSAAAAAS
jgi:hypothetical protein